MAGYPTRASLVAASSVAELTGLSTQQQDALYTAAITAVEDYAGQSFGSVEGTQQAPVSKLVDGSGDRFLWLPKRLEALAGLSIAGDAWDVASFELSPDGDRIKMIDSLLGTSWVTRAEWDPGYRPAFRTGIGNIGISGIWGWSSCPAAVGTALRYDMEDQALAQANKLAGTVASARALGISSISQGGLSVNLQAGQPTLSARAQRQLSGLVWQPTLGVVV